MYEHNAQKSIQEEIKDTTRDNVRKRKNSTMSENTQNKYAKSNYYALLDTTDDFECDQTSLSQFTKHVHSNQNKTTSVTTSNVNASSSTEQTPLANTWSKSAQSANIQNNTKSNNNKTEKIPPINIYNVEPNELITFIKNGLKIDDFKIKDLSHKGKRITLYLNTLSNYGRVINHLQKTKTNFYTFTPKSLKNKTVLLKGISADTSVDTILSELQKHERDDLKFVKVSQFYTSKSKKNGYNLSSFIVQLSADSDIRQLKNIRGILYRCIHWEALRKPEIQQCRKCQGIFHSASNCYRQPRCVKCNQSHEIGKCSITTVNEHEREKLFCVLCNKFGHPASYRGCEKYKDLQNKVKQRRSLLKQNPRVNPSYVNPNISYANILKPDATQPTGNGAYNNINFLNPLLTDLKNTIMNLSNQIINLEKQLQLQSARIDTLFSISDF